MVIDHNLIPNINEESSLSLVEKTPALTSIIFLKL